MFAVPYAKMICDSDFGDGGIFFYEEYFEWSNREKTKSFKVFYKGIYDVQIIYNFKKKVIITLKNGETKNLYLYKADTLKQIIHDAIERINGKNNESAPLAGNISDVTDNEDDVSKLERLAKLHESGALTDEEFISAKKKILD